MIDKHKYPRNYDFRMVDRGIGRQSSMLRGGKTQPNGRRRRVSEVGDSNWQARVAEGKNGQRYTNPMAPTSEQPSVNAKKDRISARKVSAQASDNRNQNQTTRWKAACPAQQGIKAFHEESTADEEIDVITSSLSSLQFIPMSVRMKDKKGSP